MDSILISVREKIGGEVFSTPGEESPFDSQLIDFINAALMRVTQLGAGTVGFNITSETETWQDFLGADANMLSTVRSYVALKVKMRFDPPASAALISLANQELLEDEWLIRSRAEGNT